MNENKELMNEVCEEFYESFFCNIAICKTYIWVDDVKANEQTLWDIENKENIMFDWNKTPQFGINNKFVGKKMVNLFDSWHYDLSKLRDLRYLGREIR